MLFITIKGNYWSNLDSDEYEVDGYADFADPYPLKKEIRKVSGERAFILVVFCVMLAVFKLQRILRLKGLILKAQRAGSPLKQIREQFSFVNHPTILNQ